MLDLRSTLANLAGKRAARRARAKLEGLLAGARNGPIEPSETEARRARMREAQALLAADEPTRAMEIVDRLIASGHNDVVLVVLWAQVAEALGRYREALTVNEAAIALADAGKLTKLAASCRTWQRELAFRVARDG